MDDSEERIANDGWYRIGIKARQNQMRGFTQQDAFT